MRRNSKPEANFQRQIFDYLSYRKFHVIPCEAKAIKSITPYGKVFWRNSGIKPGISDLLAVSPHGCFCAIELKAKGKRSTLRDIQAYFLMDVIKHNGFAIVCDSIEYFDYAWSAWADLKNEAQRREFLITELPEKFRGYFQGSA